MDGQTDVTSGKKRNGHLVKRNTGNDDALALCGDTWTDKVATDVCRSLFTE
ncbi:hypothetical protein DPMN_047375 [Dreissena polymorpha]|uniref:Uncharacterized protein n=1 Tax=Dreissena polymorpha TaxID=45954 RepID=A0A9D4HZ32_DREPO|nr:hypothetical protein DPMN_047375 [Dreissena polymorpha]